MKRLLNLPLETHDFLVEDPHSRRGIRAIYEHWISKRATARAVLR